VLSTAVSSEVLPLEAQAGVLKTQVLIKFVVIWGSTLNSQNQLLFVQPFASTSSDVQSGVDNLLFTYES